MSRILAFLIAPILPALIPLILLAACSTTPSSQAVEACEAAEKGDIPTAIEAADKAYRGIKDLSTADLCRLAASYAVITINSGDSQAAERFQEAYKASFAKNPQAAEAFYTTLDPQMLAGLEIISGLLDARGIYTSYR